MQDSTDMDAERDDPSFYFCCAAFYSQLGYFRVDDNVEEGTHLYTVQQQISKSQQDARDARSIEAMPSGLEGPSLSPLFKLFYLQLPHFRDREFLQSINKSLSVDALTIQRSQSGRPATASLQDEDAYITGDSIPVLDIVQRHHEVSFYLGDITDERDMLDILERSGVTYIVQNALLRRGAKDPSVYFRGYVEGTRAVIEAAIAAGVRRLVYTSSAGVVFDSTDVVNVDERVPYLEKLFNAYNLLPYHSTTSSEPRLDPEGATAKLNESLHRALPPICATTEYHRTTQTLSSYVAPTPNAESILSAFNTPFDPHGLMDPVVRSRSDGQAFFITSGEAFGVLGFTRVYNEYERKPSHLKLYYDIEGKEMFDDEGREAARWILAAMTGLDEDRQLHKIGSVIRWRSKVLNKVEAQLLISEGKEDGASSGVECEELLTKLRKGKFEAKHQDFVRPTVRLKADDQDRTKLAPSLVRVEDLSSKRA
ncbi:hypothetical protein BKA82DRAFT_22636 [Pisolithus tinctorius]|uniref:3-beta hydroxysteroid dehydrogenase/isomerase domain-containing protein n=1 Tax=Pisolithus tinctorius Marx 270 TaxID=870435 RepID=A0A0C3JI68_PISTI|nr:hypothetical protein BKA82DRAFT_22636 [Pisolithus tinctorius]KIO08773.1 hypothetical protein M404DRAFT_22636 [Pisolithus tinctorius Marx 270]